MTDHIQIGDISPRIQYTGNGSQTAFTYPFPIFKDSDIEVYEDATLKTLTTDYTVAGAGDSAGGMVTFGTAPASNLVVTLKRNVTIERMSDFQESGEFRAKVINDELDTITAVQQQIDDDVKRSLRLSPTDSAGSTILPDKATRTSKFLAFDAAGDPIAATGSDGVAASAFGASLVDDADASAARTTLGLVIGTDVLSPAGDGSALTGIATGATDAEKANIVLNAFRIAVNGGLSVQNMADGVVDEFEDETGVDVATSSNETYDATGNYYHNQGQTQIAQGDGTALGDLTGGGGLAAVFDGTTSQTMAVSGYTPGNVSDGYVGKDWGVAVTKTVSGFKAYASNNSGFHGDKGDTVTITLQGSTDNFAASIVDLGSAAGVVDSPSLLISKMSGLTLATAYRYHRLKISADGVAWNMVAAEVEFYEGPSAAPNMVLVSNAQTSLAQPDSAFLVLWQEDVDAVTPDTDLKAWASRDDGATWSQASLTADATLSTGRILTGTANISGQPAGTSMKWKIETLNNKEQRLRGVGLEWS